MKLELNKGNVKLGPNQTLKVVDGAGSTVTAVEGSVWITEENRPNDIVLSPGGKYTLRVSFTPKGQTKATTKKLTVKITVIKKKAKARSASVPRVGRPAK